MNQAHGQSTEIVKDSKIGKRNYDFDLKRDRNFSSIIFSHLSRINNYPKNKETMNQMYDSQYESLRKIAAYMDYPPIPDSQIESLRIQNSRQRKDGENAKPPLWAALVSNIITGFLHSRPILLGDGTIQKNCLPTRILEVGTYTGFTSAYISKRNPNSSIDTLDIDLSLVEVANRNFNSIGLHNIQAHCADYQEWDLSKYDAIFKDGLHKGQANEDLYEYCLKLKKPMLIIFDDIRWSWNMYNSWKRIANNPQTDIVIDCYHIGAILINLPERLQATKEQYSYSLPGLIPR